jgi:hypothetical protein
MGTFWDRKTPLVCAKPPPRDERLLTYDRRTIPPLLKIWAEEERTLGGVVFVDEKTISPADIGGLVWALSRLAREIRNWVWTNRIYFLRR